MARPSKYQDNFPELLIAHMGKGLSFESFGAVVGVTEETLHDWCRRTTREGQENPRFKPEFSESKKVGLAQSRLFWERIGVNAALGLPTQYKDDQGEVHTIDKYNATVWIFNMKNRFGWRDKSDVTSDDKPLEATGHEALKEIVEILKNANRDSKPNDPIGSAEQPAIPEGNGESPS